MSRNLARKGPRRVWSDYRNLRVPIEIFLEVKNYMERKKQEFLIQQEGLDDPSTKSLYNDESFQSMSPEVQGIIPQMLKQVIQEEFAKIQTSGVMAGRIPQRKKTSRERIKDLLMAHPGEELTTIQIAEILDLPSPTCRQASRELAAEDQTIKQFSGRPNRYMYIGISTR